VTLRRRTVVRAAGPKSPCSKTADVTMGHCVYREAAPFRWHGFQMSWPLAGQSISNGTVTAAAVALGFSAVTCRGVCGFWPNALINVSRRDVRRQMQR
jgi:hypothetical protein